MVSVSLVGLLVRARRTAMQKVQYQSVAGIGAVAAVFEVKDALGSSVV